MRLTPIVTGLPSPSTLLFNRPIRDVLPSMNRKPINVYADDKHYLKGNDTHKDSLSSPVGSTYLKKRTDN